VVLYISGGNDALSTLVPYTDPAYYTRRPSVAVESDTVLQIGSDAAGRPQGLHPNLGGLQSIFNSGRLAVLQRTGYADASRSHFKGTDIWATANPEAVQGPGWLGRYLGTLAAPVDPLTGWNTAGLLPHALQATQVGVPSIPSPSDYAFSSPNAGAEATYSVAAASAISSHVPVGQPQLNFVNSTAQAALATLDRVAAVAAYAPTVTYPTSGLGQALQAVAGAMATEVGTKVFWVQTGGYDTYASQGTVDGTYGGLLSTLAAAMSSFYTDLANQGLLSDTLVLLFSEFGRRVSENGSAGTDHGVGGLMMAMGARSPGGSMERPRCSTTRRTIPTSRTAVATSVTRSISARSMRM